MGHYCVAKVYYGADAWGRNTCSRTGTVERNGRWYCTQHDPEKAAQRREAREARYRAQHAAVEAIRHEAQALAARLGAGTPHYANGRYERALVLTFDEVERLIAARDADGGT